MKLQATPAVKRATSSAGGSSTAPARRALVQALARSAPRRALMASPPSFSHTAFSISARKFCAKSSLQGPRLTKVLNFPSTYSASRFTISVQSFASDVPSLFWSLFSIVSKGLGFKSATSVEEKVASAVCVDSGSASG